MGFQDFQAALQQFNSGIQDLQRQRTIDTANEQVQAIRASEASEQDKRAKLQQVSNQLVTNLAYYGTPDTTIESVRRAFGGQQAKSAEELYMQGLQTGNQEAMDLGLKAQKFELEKFRQQMEIMQHKKDVAQQLQEQKFEENKQVATDKQFSQFGKRLDASAEVRSAFGRGAIGIQQANKLEALVNTWGTNPQELNKAPPQAVYEVASALAQMIKTGVATREEVERFAPHTATLSAANMQSWLTSNPEPANVGAFVNLYLKAAKRERAEMTFQQEDAILKRAQGDFRLYNRDPEQFKSTVAERLGVTPEEVVIDPETRKVTTVDRQKRDSDFQMAKGELQKAYGALKSKDPDAQRRAMGVFRALQVDPKTPYNQAVDDVQYKVLRGLL